MGSPFSWGFTLEVLVPRGRFPPSWVRAQPPGDQLTIRALLPSSKPPFLQHRVWLTRDSQTDTGPGERGNRPPQL